MHAIDIATPMYVHSCKMLHTCTNLHTYEILQTRVAKIEYNTCTLFICHETTLQPLLQHVVLMLTMVLSYFIILGLSMRLYMNDKIWRLQAPTAWNIVYVHTYVVNNLLYIAIGYAT